MEPIDELNAALRVDMSDAQGMKLMSLFGDEPENEDYEHIIYHGRTYTKAEYQLRRKRWGHLYPPVKFPFFVTFSPDDIKLWNQIPKTPQ